MEENKVIATCGISSNLALNILKIEFGVEDKIICCFPIIPKRLTKDTFMGQTNHILAYMG